jgi:trehalose 6-phosphate synthase/phosphatase
MVNSVLDIKNCNRLIVVSHLLPTVCRFRGKLLKSSSVSISSYEQYLAEKEERYKNLELNKNFNSKWEFTHRQSHSAMNSGIQVLKQELGSDKVIHLGLPGELETVEGQKISWTELNENTEMKESLVSELYSELNQIPLLIKPETIHSYYYGYCKSVLWPLFHYILQNYSSGRKENEYWEAYKLVNEIFTQKIVEIYQPGDLIWFQDYHFLVAPSLLRKAIPTSTIGLFLHTPFPTSEIFRSLAKKKDILKGILGSNLVGFQTYSYSRHFVSNCTRILGLESTPKGIEYNGSVTSVEIFPIGIDVENLQKELTTSSVLKKIASFKERYAGKKIIIGSDKLDKTKGVEYKLKAYQKFLRLYPEWQNRVILIQITSQNPDNENNIALQTEISEMVSRINGEFGTIEHQPLLYYQNKIDRQEYYALISIADVALITSLRDGMNTMSYDYIVCQKDNFGPLILSEFTGVAGSLSDALMINPWDQTGVANAIYEALTMPKEEQIIKYKQLYKIVSTQTVQSWAKSFVTELLRNSLSYDPSIPIPLLERNNIKEKYLNAKKRLIFFDYDGTLTPIVKTPSAAVPSIEMLAALRTLTYDPNNVVFIISGRDQAFLDKHLGHIRNLGMSAEHGFIIKYPGGVWINSEDETDLTWRKDVEEIFNFYTERTQGSFVEKKKCAITWHYRLADPAYGAFQAKECQNHIENSVLSKYPIEILHGKKCLEVRPISVNKGEIVRQIMNIHPDGDFVLCAGDDRTDEDMFKSLADSNINKDNIFTTIVGPSSKKSIASWRVSEPKDLIDIMEVLAQCSTSTINN